MANVSTSDNTVELKKVRKPGKFMSALAGQKGYLYLLPALILLAVFTFYPIVNTLIYAFKNNYVGMTGKFDGWGIQNFIKVLNFPDFTKALTNTMLFAFISVPVSTLLALMISVWLNNIKWLQKAYQTIFFLPYLTNAIAIGAVFMAMFNVVSLQNNVENAQSLGLINSIIKACGGTPILWVNPGASLWAQRTVILLQSIWSALPFKILILFSALQSVNKQYYDAAKIDGAGKTKTLWRVTVPLISPMISYLVITGFMGGFKEYSTVVGIFGSNMGANKGEMQTMVGFIYQMIGEQGGRIGIASAGALILFGIIMIFTAINFFVSKKRVHY